MDHKRFNNYEKHNTSLSIIDIELWEWLKTEGKKMHLTAPQILFRIIGDFRKLMESTEPRFEDVTKAFGIQSERRDIRTIIDEEMNRK